MECLNCKNPVEQTKGKRSRLYCSDKCRVNFYRINASEGIPKRGRGRPKKIDKGVIQAEIKAVKAQVINRSDSNFMGGLPERDNALIDAARGRDSNEINMDEVRFAKKEAKKQGLIEESCLNEPIKYVLEESSKESAKLGIEAMIAAIKSEKIPEHRAKTTMGRKSWEFDQKKKIQELETELKWLTANQ